MTQEKSFTVHGGSVSRADIKEPVQTIVTGRNVFDPGI
jgi:hypothetical protein